MRVQPVSPATFGGALTHFIVLFPYRLSGWELEMQFKVALFSAQINCGCRPPYSVLRQKARCAFLVTKYRSDISWLNYFTVIPVSRCVPWVFILILTSMQLPGCSINGLWVGLALGWWIRDPLSLKQTPISSNTWSWTWVVSTVNAIMTPSFHTLHTVYTASFLFNMARYNKCPTHVHWHFFPPFGAVAQRGPWPPHSWGF